MSKGSRRSLFILAATMLMMFAVNAMAQMDCDECDPYNNYCSDPCQRCRIYGYDGCESYTESTCGGPFGGGACLQDDCTPNWVETSRVTQGTYDGNSWNSCTHHSVQWVTLVDYNACNNVESFRTQHYCDNVIDGERHGGWYPSCCNQLNDDDEYDPLFTCDGNHYCTG